MKRFLAAFALILLAAASPARAANIQNIDLGKKAEVWFAEDHTVPIISFNISLPAGSAYDPAGKAGLAAFAGAMMDEGAGGPGFQGLPRGAGQPRHLLQRPGRARLSGDLHLHPEGECARSDASAATGADPAALRQRALTRVRAQIIQSLQQEQAEPPRVAARGFMRAFFGGHAYAHPVIGEIGSISSITAADLRNFARSHWVKNGLKVAVAGDITAPALTKLLGETFLPVSGASAAARCPMSAGWARPACMSFRCRCRSPPPSFGLPGIMRQDPDFIPGYVANYILGGGGFSSRLMEEVRVKRGLTYGISTSLTAYNKASGDAGIGRDPRRCHPPDRAGGEGHDGEFRQPMAPPSRNWTTPRPI